MDEKQDIFKKYTKKFLVNTFEYGLLVILLIIYLFVKKYVISGFIISGMFIFLVAYFTHKELAKKSVKVYTDEIKKLTSELEVARHEENLWRQLLKERASGFPTLFTNIAYYESLIDEELAGHLRTKSHPAISSALVIQAEAKRRRDAEFANRTTQAIIEYYENIAPFLLDFKEEIISDDEDAIRNFTEEEREDPVTNYLAKEEYRKLPSVERNQMALDRFWKRPKSKWLLGRIYERYVGYLYEEQGYEVEYTGIFHGYEDLGRDLICTKGNEIIVIQCKNWSQFKTIYEKHIFQFFGTVFQYADQNPEKKIKAIFYTTTEVSELARRFAHELNIELKEGFKMSNNYSCIKCNVSYVDGTKIYHLPFDQMYDKTKIEKPRGEFYCQTVKEAEEAGFRRAFRYRGVTEKK